VQTYLSCVCTRQRSFLDPKLEKEVESSYLLQPSPSAMTVLARSKRHPTSRRGRRARKNVCRRITMSFLRPHSSLKLARGYTRSPRAVRCLSATAIRPQEDPRAIPDLHEKQLKGGDEAAVIEIDHQDKPQSAVDTYYPHHQPDYNATIDHGTSSYSPVPKRVMNGSEPGETTPAAILSGAPIDLQARAVR